MSKKIIVKLELEAIPEGTNDDYYEFKSDVRFDFEGVDNTDVLIIALARALQSQLKNSLGSIVQNAYDTADLMKQLTLCECQDEED